MRVFLADDHRLVREGLRALLERAGVEVVGDAANGREAIAGARLLRPDVVAIDLAMPELNGVDATRRITAELPGVKVLAVSVHADPRYVIAMLEAGAVGYLLKSAAAEELVAAVSAAARGETYLSPTIAGMVVGHAIRNGAQGRAGLDRPLSTREREVLQLLAEGKSSKEIGAILQIAVPTVETHRHQIMEKLDVHTIAGLTKYAIREGLTSAEP